MSELQRVLDGLAQQAIPLAMELLPGGRREGREWVARAAASPFGCSTGVHLFPPRAGVWSAWAAAESGDALDLVARIRCAGDKKAALRWAREWLGQVQERPCQAGRNGPAQASSRAQPSADDAARRSRQAQAIWLAASPTLGATPVDRYLAGRSIDLARLAAPPRALRYAPRLQHPAGLHWPAMVAAITRDGRFVAVHRTFLALDGPGKAPVQNAKLSFGPKRGGLISLARGRSGKPLREAPADDRLIISEGIEDGLTAALACPAYRVVAAVDLGNIALLELPPQLRDVTLLGQQDPWWSDSQATRHGASRGIDVAIRKLQADGRTVRIARPRNAKDFNAMLTAA